MFDSVRSRLTLWYVGVLALVLVVFSVSVYALLARDFYERLDNDLHTSVEETGGSMARRIAGGEPPAPAGAQSCAKITASKCAAVCAPSHSGDARPESRAAAEALEEHVGPREAA